MKIIFAFTLVIFFVNVVTGQTLQTVTDAGSITTNSITSTAQVGFRNNVNGINWDWGAASTDNTWKLNNTGIRTIMTVLSSNGNVGIGTQTPAYRLEVNGTGNFSGTLTQAGNQVWHTGNFNPVDYAVRKSLVTDVYFNDYSQSGGTFNKGSVTTIRSVNYNYVQGLSLNHSGSGWTSQIVIPYANSDGDRIFFRKANGITSWGSWQEFWHTGNFSPSSYLQLAGGNITGNITIGTSSLQRKLDVNGDIKTRKIKVTQVDWADDVFDSTYSLMPLHQIEQFISRHKHLPDVPSAETVKKNGVDLGDNQAVLLRKIEELTLYIIEQDKKNAILERKLADIEKRLSAIQTATE